MLLDPSSGPARFSGGVCLSTATATSGASQSAGKGTLIVKRTMSAGFTPNISCAILTCR